MNPVDSHIATFPPATQKLLQQIRETILNAAPQAEESISYGMPAYKINGRPLVYFAGYKNHIGFYATPTGHKEFEAELSRYKQGKGSVQFPLNQDLPTNLISRIVTFRMKENKAKS